MQPPPRIPVELGTVDLEQRTLLGRPEVHLTPMEARLLGHLAARPGQVVSKEALLAEVWGLPPGAASRTVFATLERLRRKVERDPHDPHHLVTIGRSGYTFRPLAEAPPAAPPAPPLPRGFVGRSDELRRLRRALQPPHAVVTVHGPGGVGKTRLVAELLRGWDGPAWTAALEGATGGEEVRRRVARALDVVADPDPARARARVGRVARDGLLVLDGAEGHVAEVAALVAGAGPARPRFLVTSREPLGTPGEEVLPLAPLPLPGDGATDAVDLFLALAASRRPGWTPDPPQRRALEALVTALDGLPLAIEVAASWSSVLDPGEILRRVERVAARPVDPATPGRTVHRAVRTSWEALDDHERQALAACSVFEAPFTAVAAEAVIGGDAALDPLERLVSRSLVQPVDGPARRFRVLALVRAFVAEQVGAPAAAQARHGAWFGARAREWSAALERGALRSTYAAVAEAEADLLQVVAHGSDGDAADAALAVAAVAKDLGPVTRWLEVVTDASTRPGAPPAARVRLLVSRAAALRYSGRAAEASAALDEARALAETAAPDRRGAVALATGTLHFHCGEGVVARRSLEEALRWATLDGDPYLEGVARAELATLAWRSHHLEEAARGYREALRLFRKLGARHPEAVYLGNLGIVELTAGRFELALDAFHAALALHRELGSARFECATRTNLGVLEDRRERYDDAREHFLAALALCERTGDARDHAIAALNLASIGVAQRRVSEARRWLDGAEDQLAGLGLGLQAADAALCWAGVHRLEGDAQGALAALARAEDLARRHDIPFVRARALAARGLLARDRGDAEGAAALLTAAEEAFAGSEAAVHEVPELRELRARP